MKRLWLGCLLLAVVALTGCAVPQRQQQLIHPLNAQKIGYAPLWATNLDLPSDEEISNLILRDDLLLIVETPTNIINAVSLKDGSVLWRQVPANGRDHIVGICRKGNQILVNSETFLYDLNAQTGKITGVQTLDQGVSNAPALYGDYAIFGGVNGMVFAHDLNSGFKKWAYQLTDHIAGQPVLIGHNVYVNDRNGVVALLSAENGEVSWRFHPTEDVAAQAVGTNLAVYVPMADSKLHALNRTTGRDRWVYRGDLQSGAAPLVVGNLVFQSLQSGEWAAVDALTGNELWRIKARLHSVALLKQGLLLATENRLLLVDPQNGQISVTVPTMPTKAMLPGPAGSMILVSSTGRILRIDPQ